MKNLHEKVFYVALYLSYALYIIAFFQIDQYNPKYLNMLDIFIKYYVMIFLLFKFNPFVKSTFTEFDRTIVFSSAIFLLTTTVFSNIAENLGLSELTKIWPEYARTNALSYAIAILCLSVLVAALLHLFFQFLLKYGNFSNFPPTLEPQYSRTAEAFELKLGILV